MTKSVQLIKFRFSFTWHSYFCFIVFTCWNEVRNSQEPQLNLVSSSVFYRHHSSYSIRQKWSFGHFQVNLIEKNHNHKLDKFTMNKNNENIQRFVAYVFLCMLMNFLSEKSILNGYFERLAEIEIYWIWNSHFIF